MVKACESSFLVLVNQSLGPVMQLLETGLCSFKTVTATLGHFQPLLGLRCSSTGCEALQVCLASFPFMFCVAQKACGCILYNIL